MERNGTIFLAGKQVQSGDDLVRLKGESVDGQSVAVCVATDGSRMAETPWGSVYDSPVRRSRKGFN